MKRTLIAAVIVVLWMMAPAYAVPEDVQDDDVLPAATCLDPETVFNTGPQLGAVATLKIDGPGVLQIADRAWSLFGLRPPVADRLIIAVLN